jgi:hypothetical protein
MSPPKLSDSETITLAVCQMLWGIVLDQALPQREGGRRREGVATHPCGVGVAQPRGWRHRDRPDQDVDVIATFEAVLGTTAPSAAQR